MIREVNVYVVRRVERGGNDGGEGSRHVGMGGARTLQNIYRASLDPQP